ncbi:MAG: DUF3105 domain-containing protein [Chloroflexi bacterium]|nr:DUF3105 domain-containing protein [Chloroflexota bacterium]
MGVGLFLVYPALFTDVTDSYRLSRAGRLRTDLGGIYFHLLAALGIIGLYLLTGQPFLLLGVLLIDVEIVRQLIPFLRLDGYWVLTDLAGVPDLFSQAGPFIRSLLGSRGGAGERLPELRRAPRVTFLVFLALTIPALAVLIVLVVGGVPALVAAASDATLHQLGQLAEAREQGRADGIALALLQLALAVLPLAVTVYLIVLVGRRLLAGLVGWGRVNPRRALTAGLTGVGAAAVLGILWIPQLPFLASAPGDVQTVAVAGRSHVQGSVAYEQRPPVGGDHAPIWQNCGFYDAPIADENVVHSLEHGAVWIAYRPELPDDQKARLRSIAYSQIHILVSPYDGLSAPVVTTAWGRQLAVDGPDDPRLRQFIQAFRLAATAPERGGACTEGVGTPR